MQLRGTERVGKCGGPLVRVKQVSALEYGAVFFKKKKYCTDVVILIQRSPVPKGRKVNPRFHELQLPHI